jgi:uncharacterized membrane protein
MNSSSVLSSISTVLALFAGKLLFATVVTVLTDLVIGEFFIFIESKALPGSE